MAIPPGDGQYVIPAYAFDVPVLLQGLD